MSVLQQQLTGSQQQLASSQQQLSTMQEQLQAQQERMHSMDMTINEHLARVSFLEQDRERLMSRSTGLEFEMNSQKTLLVSRTEDLETLRSSTHTQNDAQWSAVRRLAECLNSSLFPTDVDTDVAALFMDREILSERVKQLENDIAKKDLRFQKLTNDFKKLEDATSAEKTQLHGVISRQRQESLGQGDILASQSKRLDEMNRQNEAYFQRLQGFEGASGRSLTAPPNGRFRDPAIAQMPSAFRLGPVPTPRERRDYIPQ